MASDEHRDEQLVTRVADRLQSLEQAVNQQHREARLTFIASVFGSLVICIGGVVAAVLLAGAAKDSAAIIVQGDQSANDATIEGNRSAFMAEQRRLAYGKLSSVTAGKLREIQLYRDRVAGGEADEGYEFGLAHQAVREAAWDTRLVGDYLARWRAYCLVRTFETLPDMMKAGIAAEDWTGIERRLDDVQRLVDDFVADASKSLFVEDGAGADGIEDATCPAKQWYPDLSFKFVG